VDCGKILVVSYGFAARMKDDLRAVPFDLVVLDEAHKLRNAYQPSRKGGHAVRWAFELRQKLLLTATPLQNSLLELYGLGWIIDEHVFGDRGAFQARYCNAGGDLAGLRGRLAQVCKRTLRKDCAYINYKKRQAMTHPFPQTDEERSLHQDVMQFMAQEISFAFPQRQRQLIEMILFKTLASSPQALASTLRTMRRRLVAIRDGLPETSEDSLIGALAHDEDIDIEAIIEQLDESEGQPDLGNPIVQGKLIAKELAQIDSLIARAERISSDSKSKALLKALEAAFARLQELGAQRKALIFTESRKTQQFLAAFLESNGYAGKVVTFNGSNAHPSAKIAYERFLSNHAGTDKITGSKSVDIRSALIEEFRDHAEILLATEAAAEGVNLQFCSLVVNYDLPWNPQRIEQRIGRCHRYGQRHDVVVVNFLSQDNVADRRVQELLQQKFSLFDGLFGASDEVLGAIEEGVDFEKRVLAILKTCRTDEEIERAFDALRRELEGTISEKMSEARRQLFEHFDADVHERLRLQGDDARVALDRVGERFWRLARWSLEGKAAFDDALLTFDLSEAPTPGVPTGRYRLISAVRAEEEYAATEAHLLRLSGPLGQWILGSAKEQAIPPVAIRFNVSGYGRKVSVLKPIMGHAGWLRLDKLTLDSDAREEFLLFTAVRDDGQNVEQEVIGRLMDAPATTFAPPALDAGVEERLASDAEALRHSTLARATENSNQRFRRAQEQVDRWADDVIEGAEAELESLRRAIREVRRQADLAETVQMRQDSHARLLELERQRHAQRREIFDLEDRIEAKRRALIDELRNRSAQRSSMATLFITRWEAV